MANISKVLQELDNTWEEAETTEIQGGFTVLPDGNYTGKLLSGSVEMSQNGRIQIVWALKVTEGKHEGKTIKKFSGIDNEIAIGYAKGLMKLVGIAIPKDVTKLPKALNDFFGDKDGIDIEFSVKTKDEFTNIYINSAKPSNEAAPADKPSKSKPDKPAKKKKLTYTDLEDMDKAELIELVKERELDIDDAESIKETKLRRLVAEELDIEVD